MKQHVIKTLKPVSYIFGALFSMSVVMGFQCEFFGNLLPHSWKSYFFFVLLFVIATLFSKLFWDMIKEKKSNAAPAFDSGDSKKPDKKAWPFYTAFIWICHFVMFLGVYPGFFVYDAFEELNETITRSFSDQHPLFHVLSMGAIIQGAHKLTGNYNISVAIFILLQMSVNAVILGYVVSRAQKSGAKKQMCVILSLYFGLFPVLVMCDLCSSKDCIFTGILVLLTIYLKDCFNYDQSSIPVSLYIKIALATLIMMLYRNNGVYAIILFMAVYVLWALISHAGIKKGFVYTILGTAAVYVLINAALIGLTGAERIGHREILTVPIMQLSRVYAYDREDMPAEDISKLESYIPKENLMQYTPKCSDMVKIGFDEQAFLSDKTGFLKLWIKTGLDHPVAYLDAFCMTSYGMWYSNATLDGYKGREVFTFTYDKSSYFGYETEPPGNRISFIPVIDGFYRYLSIEGGEKAIPIASLVFSPGFMLWMYLFGLGYFLYTGQVKRTIAYIPALATGLTCFLGPMSLLRYAFYLWILVPVLFWDMLKKPTTLI